MCDQPMMKCMRRILLTIFLVASLGCNAQLRVDSKGHTGFGLDSVQLSTADAGTWGNNRYQVYVVGNRHGLYSECFRPDYGTGFGIALDGFSDVNGANFSVGLKSTAMSKNGGTGSGRAYGLLACAGNAASGYNYAVFGSLANQSKGAAIFGTVTHDNMGNSINGRYAGYFMGNVKIIGDVSVVGGTVYSNAVSNSSSETTNYELFHESSETALERMTSLTPIEYKYNHELLQEELLQKSNTVDATPVDLKLLDIESPDKTHYGIPVEELEKTFPNLVYESADGNKYVNYIEMIPVLVEAMKELTGKVTKIEGEVKR